MTNAKSTMLEKDVSKMIDRIATAVIPITDQGKPHDNLMKDTFNALLTAPSTKFQ